MQNAGQQYGQGGGISSHQNTTNFGHSESNAGGGSITSSLRQFRRKAEEKHSISDPNTPVVPESHVARVAPHNHYPSTSRPGDCFRYPAPYQDYSVPSQVKYSEISEPHQEMQEHLSTSVIQKTKGKDYMDMCNIQQPHIMKQPYSDHINSQQPYSDHSLPQSQYLPKEAQIHSLYKPESQYFTKDPQYPGQLPHQMQKYNVPSSQVRNDFLSKLQRIHPTMARSIMSEHHLQETQRTYQGLDQNRMYPHPNQRYMNHSSPTQSNVYPHGYVSSHHQPSYSNYLSSCSYTRGQQIPPRFPPINPHERSISPRRNYSDSVSMPMNYSGIASKISPNYSQYNSSDYSQPYQQRRAAISQDYYQQHCRTTQFVPHQMPSQDLAETGRVTVSDSIKQYIENWADEDTEINQIENNRLCKDNVRIREEQAGETIYTINASELQYLEPIGESGIPVVTSENGQYVIKSGVSIDNSSGMIRIVEKNSQSDADHGNERVVNLHIMDPLKPDCMMAKADLTQRLSEEYKSKIVIQQNTVIQSSIQSSSPSHKEPEISEKSKIASNLPTVTNEHASLEEELNRTMIREGKKVMADKNCSPINLENLKDDDEEGGNIIYPSKKVLEDIEAKHMPILDRTEKEISLKQDDSETTESENSDFSDRNSSCVDSEMGENDVERSIKDIDETESNKNYASIEKSGGYHMMEFKANAREDIINDGVEENKNDESEETEDETSSSLDSDNEDEPELEKNEEIIRKQGNYTENNVSPTESPKFNKISLTSYDVVMQNATENKTNQTAKPQQNEPNPVVKLDAEEEKRTKPKKFFSVDDIINNIGPNVNKLKQKNLERRHTIHATNEFLEREVNNTFVEERKSKTIEAINVENSPFEPVELGNDRTEVKEYDDELKIEDQQDPINYSMKEEEQKQKETNEEEEKKEENINEKNVEIENTEEERKEVETKEEAKKEEAQEISTSAEIIDDDAKNFEKITTECEESTILGETTAGGTNEIKPENKSIEEVNVDSVEIKNEIKEENVSAGVPIISDQSEFKDIKNKKHIEETLCETESYQTSTQQQEEVCHTNEFLKDIQEIQYRNIIKVEDSNVILHIAGELVVLNVHAVNGKKVITVVPLSNSTVVDFNDNYEIFDSNEETDPLKLDNNDKELQVVEYENAEPELVEPTSEVIIGMDLSLEEEIQLDLEQPQVVCTKAAKKAYDCDLQIPSITTSEDVYENTSQDSDPLNDKVSSSKEKDQNLKEDSKTTDEEHSKIKNVPDGTEDDEFVPFKELVKARKLRKMKMKDSSANNEIRADSTNKIDEICKENNTDLAKKETKLPIADNDNKLKKDKFSKEKLNIKNELKVKKEKPTKKVNFKELKQNSPPLEKPAEINKKVDESSSQPNEKIGARKKLSLEEYNKRKRKIVETTASNIPLKRSYSNPTTPDVPLPKVKIHRVISLDDSTGKNVKETVNIERLPSKSSVWEDSPNNKAPNNVMDELKCDTREENCKSSEDEMLQIYKEQVESKLSSLSIQIPRGIKPSINSEQVLSKPFSKPEITSLMQRFLHNDRLTPEEMQKVRKIVSYKRLVQQLKKEKPVLAHSTLKLQYEIKKELGERDMKLHLKKLPGKNKGKRRFRNLYGDSSAESDSDVNDGKNQGDYSVIQSNCLAGVVPKLIIKRKQEVPVPFVKLERLDMRLVVNNQK